MTIEKKLEIQEEAAFALRLALNGISGQIIEAEIEIALSRHQIHTKHGTNPLSHVEQGWQEWKKTKPKVKSFPDLPR